jgi:MSHA biogenesis protein MshI
MTTLEQQVNLFQPILRSERRLFSARAIAFGLLFLCVALVLVASFAAYRVARVEHEVRLLEQRASAREDRELRLAAAARPAQSLAELEATAKELAQGIAARERAVELAHQGETDAATSFAARLEALADSQSRIEGLWLRRILLSSSDGRLALEGAALEPGLVPAYLAELGGQRALGGASLDRFALREAKGQEAPAQVLFRIAGASLAPGLDVPAKPESEPKNGWLP